MGKALVSSHWCPQSLGCLAKPARVKFTSLYGGAEYFINGNSHKYPLIGKKIPLPCAERNVYSHFHKCSTSASLEVVFV